MDDKRVNYFTQIYKSISDIEFYRYFEGRSIGKAFLYLLMVTLILGTLSLVRPIYDFNTGVHSLMDGFKREIPEFELREGKLDVKGDSPIIIGDGNDSIIIDTTGNTDETVLDQYENIIFISSDRILVKQNGLIESPLNFSDLRGITLTKSSVENLLPVLRWVTFFIIGFGLIWFYLSKFFSIFLLSLLGIIVCGISRFKVKYDTIFKLSFYAITAPILIKVIIRALAIDIPFFSFIYYSVGAAYLWFAARMLTEETEEFKEI